MVDQLWTALFLTFKIDDIFVLKLIPNFLDVLLTLYLLVNNS